MRRPWILLLLTAGLALPGTACRGPRATVVLVPDREGHVGVVSVSNPQGTVELSRAGEAVSLPGATAPPGRPTPMDPGRLQALFGPALAAEPPGPLSFLVYFRTGSTDPEATSLAALDRILEAVRQRDSRDISINGHTDTTGDSDTNLRLSAERATRVRDLLVQRGLRPEHLSLAHHGMGNPLVPTPMNVAEPRNRRVEVIVR